MQTAQLMLRRVNFEGVIAHAAYGAGGRLEMKTHCLCRYRAEKGSRQKVRFGCTVSGGRLATDDY